MGEFKKWNLQKAVLMRLRDSESLYIRDGGIIFVYVMFFAGREQGWRNGIWEILISQATNDMTI